MHRHQTGYIWRKGRSWYGRWWDDVLREGQVVRTQRSKMLAEYCDRFRTESDVRPLLEEILRPLNEGRSDARGTMPIAEYVEKHYLPNARVNLKPSTYYGYSHIFRHYLAPRIPQKMVLRDFRTMHATNILEMISRQTGIRRKHLQHIKAFLSAMFRRAISQGVIDGPNPIREAEIPKAAGGIRETHAASLEQVLAMLNLKTLSLTAKTAIALIYFCGLRPGEGLGANWEDYDGKQLCVRRSIWRGHVTTPKTENSIKPIPVIEPLRTILEECRAANGNPTAGPILRGQISGKPISLDNLAYREVRPVLKAAGIPWFGWYALRRGIASALDEITKRPNAASILLRHTNLSVTLEHYIKPNEQEMLDAMTLLERLCGTSTAERLQ